MPLRIGTPLPSLEGATEWLSGSVEEVSTDSAFSHRAWLQTPRDKNECWNRNYL